MKEGGRQLDVVSHFVSEKASEIFFAILNFILVPLKKIFFRNLYKIYLTSY